MTTTLSNGLFLTYLDNIVALLGDQLIQMTIKLPLPADNIFLTLKINKFVSQISSTTFINKNMLTLKLIDSIILKALKATILTIYMKSEIMILLENLLEKEWKVILLLLFLNISYQLARLMVGSVVENKFYLGKFNPSKLKLKNNLNFK